MLDQHFSIVDVTTTTTDLEPLSRDDVRKYSRISSDVDDIWIDSAIKAARMLVEKRTGRQIKPATLELRLDRFRSSSASISIPRPPMTALTSVSYIKDDGSSTTISSSDMLLDVSSEPARLSPVYNQTWPAPRLQNNAVTITYTCGYADRSSVPEPLRQAMLMLIGHWYENRESVSMGIIPQDVQFTFTALCGAYRFGDIH